MIEYIEKGKICDEVHVMAIDVEEKFPEIRAAGS